MGRWLGFEELYVAGYPLLEAMTWLRMDMNSAFPEANGVFSPLSL